MEKTQWKVEGMDCSNCALTIRRYLEKKGMHEVKVNFSTGDVSFDGNGQKTEDLVNGIGDLGYKVVDAPTVPFSGITCNVSCSVFHSPPCSCFT